MLAYLPPPDPNSLPLQSNSTLNISGGNVTLNPGLYVGGISVTGGAKVTLNPGIYYLQNGGLSVSGNKDGRFTAQGVMIYETGGVSITGNRA